MFIIAHHATFFPWLLELHFPYLHTKARPFFVFEGATWVSSYVWEARTVTVCLQPGLAVMEPENRITCSSFPTSIWLADSGLLHACFRAKANDGVSQHPSPWEGAWGRSHCTKAGIIYALLSQTPSSLGGFLLSPSVCVLQTVCRTEVWVWEERLW